MQPVQLAEDMPTYDGITTVSCPEGDREGKVSARLKDMVSLFLNEDGEMIAFFNAPTVVMDKVMTPCEL